MARIIKEIERVDELLRVGLITKAKHTKMIESLEFQLLGMNGKDNIMNRNKHDICYEEMKRILERERDMFEAETDEIYKCCIEVGIGVLLGLGILFGLVSYLLA